MGNVILAAGSTKSGGGSYLFLIVIVGVLGLMYFVTIRPQRNRQRRVTQTQSEVVVGQRVRTTAGIYGTLTFVDGNDVMLEIAPGVEIRILRRAIMEVLSGDSDAEATGASPDGAEAAHDDEHAYEDADDTGHAAPATADGASAAASGRNESDVTAVDGSDAVGDKGSARAKPAE
jgi:preprotein translocase subunit YajC